MFAVAVAFLAPLSLAQQGKPIDSLPAGKALWEYRVLIPNEEGPDKHEIRRNNVEVQLQDIGKDGWELVDMPYLKGIRYQVMIFKRLKTY